MSRYYVSKYLEGVMSFDGEPSSHDPKYIYPASGGWRSFTLGRDCHATEAEARAALEARRVKKVNSLNKQIAALSQPIPAEVKPL